MFKIWTCQVLCRYFVPLTEQTKRTCKIMKKNQKKRDDLAAVVSGIHSVTEGYVRMVVRGDRENDAILKTYRQILAGKNQAIEIAKKQTTI